MIYFIYLMPEDVTTATNEDEEEAAEKEERVLKDPTKEMMSVDDNEDDYDTDLEEYFPPSKSTLLFNI